MQLQHDTHTYRYMRERAYAHMHFREREREIHYVHSASLAYEDGILLNTMMDTVVREVVTVEAMLVRDVQQFMLPGCHLQAALACMQQAGLLMQHI